MNAIPPSGEQTLVENLFGTVTSKRVIYFREKGWFSGGSREDIPLQHVTSVRVDVARSILAGFLLVLIGLPLISQGSAISVFGLAMAILGGILLWGSPSVVVNTAGRDVNASKGWPWQRTQANAFVEALRTQLFKSS